MKPGEIKVFRDVHHNKNINRVLRQMVNGNKRSGREKGRVRIITHPLFANKDFQYQIKRLETFDQILFGKDPELKANIKEAKAQYQHYLGYLEKLKSKLTHAPQILGKDGELVSKPIPHIVFLEENRIEEFKKWLEPIKKDLAHPIIIIPTYEASICPTTDDLKVESTVLGTTNVRPNLDNEPVKKRFLEKRQQENLTYRDTSSQLTREIRAREIKKVVNWIKDDLNAEEVQIGGEMAALENTPETQILLERYPELNRPESFLNDMDSPKIFLQSQCVGELAKEVKKHSNNELKVTVLRTAIGGHMDNVPKPKLDIKEEWEPYYNPS